MTRVKLCGVTTEGDRDAAVAAGADAVGVVVDVEVDTPREVSVDRAADLLAALPPFVTGVAVTMPGTVADALALQERVGADAVQVHGALAPAAVAELRERTAADVIAGVGPDEAAAYAGSADAILVDSVDADGGGGTGETHDWTAARALVADLDTPVVLAGGLTPDNVRQAVEAVDPFAVDTASGVERRGGEKDHGAMRAFVERARGGVPA
jgi:phosphoribosylanthranilate isomerase